MKRILDNTTIVQTGQELAAQRAAAPDGQDRQRAVNLPAMHYWQHTNFIGFWPTIPSNFAAEPVATDQRRAYYDPDLFYQWRPSMSAEEQRQSISIHCRAQNLLMHLTQALSEDLSSTKLFIFLATPDQDIFPPSDFDASFIKQVSNQQSIRYLNLTIELNNPFYGFMIKVLQSLDSNWEVALDIKLNTPSSPEQASQLALIKSLAKLSLSFCRSDKEDPELSDQEEWDLDVWTAALVPNTNLTELALHSVESTFLGKKFSDALKNICAVKKLEIVFDNNTEDQARLVCEGLTGNPSVRDLDLQLDTLDLESAYTLVKEHRTLEKLCLFLPELYQITGNGSRDADNIAEGKAAAEYILNALFCNLTLHHFEFFEFDPHREFSVGDWPELSLMGSWINIAMLRNNLYRRAESDGGTWIAQTNAHRMLNLVALEQTGTTLPYIPREIAAQIAMAVALMLPPAEASRILRALHVWDIPEIVEASEYQ